MIATVQDDLSDDDALALQGDLTEKIERHGARGVILDLTTVETIDSFLGRLLHEITLGCRLLGAETVVVGLQPAVAITLVELGMDLRGVRTALNCDRGLAVVRRLIDGGHAHG